MFLAVDSAGLAGGVAAPAPAVVAGAALLVSWDWTRPMTPPGHGWHGVSAQYFIYLLFFPSRKGVGREWAIVRRLKIGIWILLAI